LAYRLVDAADRPIPSSLFAVTVKDWKEHSTSGVVNFKTPDFIQQLMATDSPCQLQIGVFCRNLIMRGGDESVSPSSGESISTLIELHADNSDASTSFLDQTDTVRNTCNPEFSHRFRVPVDFRNPLSLMRSLNFRVHHLNSLAQSAQKSGSFFPMSAETIPLLGFVRVTIAQLIDMQGQLLDYRIVDEFGRFVGDCTLILAPIVVTIVEAPLVSAHNEHPQRQIQQLQDLPAKVFFPNAPHASADPLSLSLFKQPNLRFD